MNTGTDTRRAKRRVRLQGAFRRWITRDGYRHELIQNLEKPFRITRRGDGCLDENAWSVVIFILKLSVLPWALLFGLAPGPDSSLARMAIIFAVLAVLLTELMSHVQALFLRAGVVEWLKRCGTYLSFCLLPLIVSYSPFVNLLDLYYRPPDKGWALIPLIAFVLWTAISIFVTRRFVPPRFTKTLSAIIQIGGVGIGAASSIPGFRALTDPSQSVDRPLWLLLIAALCNFGWAMALLFERTWLLVFKSPLLRYTGSDPLHRS